MRDYTEALQQYKDWQGTIEATYDALQHAKAQLRFCAAQYRAAESLKERVEQGLPIWCVVEFYQEPLHQSSHRDVGEFLTYAEAQALLTSVALDQDDDYNEYEGDRFLICKMPLYWYPAKALRA